MSAGTGQNDADRSRQQDNAPTSAQRAALRADFEERLAAARIERAKVLAAKTLARKKKPAKHSNFTGGPIKGTEGFAQVRAALDASDVSDIGPARSAPQPAVVAVDPNAIAAAEDAPERSHRLMTPTVMIAFACLFGLGFGGMLGLGVVMGLGWVSLSDLKVQPAAEIVEPQVIADTVPVGLDALGQAVDAADQPLATTLFSVVATEPVAPARRAVAVQKVDTGAVDGPVMAASPGPKIDTVTHVAASPGGPQPTLGVIFTPFEPPSRDILRPLPAIKSLPGRDVLPAVLERGPVKITNLAATVTVPSADGIRVVLPSAADGRPSRVMPVHLPVAVDEAPLAFAESLPNNPIVQSVVLESLVPPRGAGPTEAELAPLVEPALDRAVVLSALSAPVQEQELPQVGGSVVRPQNLAAELGYVGEDTKQIALITYAPASVTQSALQDKLGDLATTGFPVAAANRVNFKVSKTHVRYYTPADETVARAIAAEVGGIARDFTREKVASPSGRIEVWMAGSRVGAAPKPRSVRTTAQRRAALKAQQQARAKTQLKSRLIDNLKRKEYLR